MDRTERELTTINARDVLASLGIPKGTSPLRRHLELLFRHPARAFARQMLAFDSEVDRRGLREAARGLVRVHAPGLRVRGAERLPLSGPLLILSNHPGMADTLALFASIPRDDLAILAADRPFLRALAALSRSLIAVPEDRSQPVGHGAPGREAPGVGRRPAHVPCRHDGAGSRRCTAELERPWRGGPPAPPCSSGWCRTRLSCPRWSGESWHVGPSTAL